MLSGNLKNAREKAGYSQKALGALVGIDPITIWRWEKGKNTPTSENLHALAEALGVSVEYLLNGADGSPALIHELPADSAGISQSGTDNGALPPPNARRAVEHLSLPFGPDVDASAISKSESIVIGDVNTSPSGGLLSAVLPNGTRIELLSDTPEMRAFFMQLVMCAK